MRQREFRVLLLCLALISVFATSAIGEVKGKWFTDREKALDEAQKLKKPVLAVAMDHA